MRTVHNVDPKSLSPDGDGDLALSILPIPNVSQHNELESVQP